MSDPRTGHPEPGPAHSPIDLGQLFPLVGAVLGGLAVAAGAFGAHGLRGRLGPGDLAIFETAARYQMYHALALFAVAWAIGCNARWGTAAGWLFLGGTLVFSGSLYALVLTGPRWLGAVTPLGGVALILGWACLAVAVLKRGA
jgi:uncharacterized membrane protein YgdD (TMEM256/DUF423 family)